MSEIAHSLAAVGQGTRPFAIIAKTVKGAGIPFVADKEGWHGKALSKEEAARAIAELQPRARSGSGISFPAPSQLPLPKNELPASYPPLRYKPGELVATREAYGNALARLGEVDERIVAMDGDTKNSTFSEKFFKKFPNRFTECFIAEQNMVGLALGFGARVVSGYNFNPALQGQPGTTHAWAEVFVPGAGWITFDPTNRQTGGFNLIPVAVARDLRQAMPVSGTFTGPNDAQVGLTVAVRVTEKN